MVQLTGNGQIFVQYWARCELSCGTSARVIHVLKAPSIGKRYLCVYCQWIKQYLSNKAGAAGSAFYQTRDEKETELLVRPMIELWEGESAERNKIFERLELHFVEFIVKSVYSI